MEDIDLSVKHKGLLVTHLNVRSIWNKIDLLKTTFNKFNIDIITFSETWLNEVIPNELIDFERKEIIRNDRKWKNVESSDTIKKGGGVCMYIRKLLKMKTGHIVDLEASNIDIECQYQEIVFENQKNELFFYIYRPPQGNVGNCIKHLDKNFETIDQTKLDIILLGDLNIDFSINSNQDTKKVNRFITQNGLTKLISGNTRYGKIKNSCIDQIITNSNHILNIGVTN